MTTICLKGGRIIDPSNERDEIGDLYYHGRKIISENKAKNTKYYDATGLIIFPGLIDLRCHINNVNDGNCENIYSVSKAAKAGGYTTVVLMPDLNPSPDNSATIQFIKDQINKDACINVELTGCLTKSSDGKELAPIGSLKKAGVVALTDIPNSPQNNQIFYKAIEYASMFDIPVIDLPRDLSLSEKGNAHDGPEALKMGLGGFPRIAEELHVQRAISIAKNLDTKIHISSISSIGSVDMIRDAKKKGVLITADTTPEHIFLTEKNICEFNTNFKITPPLREEKDQKAIVNGLMDGTLDCISSGHKPYEEHDKNVEYDLAPEGVISLETSLNISFKALKNHESFSWLKLIDLLSLKPSKILKLNGASLNPGMNADIVVYDPKVKWVYQKQNNYSNAKNSPYDNMSFDGKVINTIHSGDCRLNLKEIKSN